MASRPAKANVYTITRRVLVVREQKVMIDADLAELYGVSTKALNQAVKRNKERFPAEFTFRLTRMETQEVVTNCDHLARLKYSRTLPFAYTEHGALMLGNVLKSPRAVKVSLLVVRAFVQLREVFATHRALAAKLDELERKVSSHDETLAHLFGAIRQMMRTPAPSGRPIGFTADLGTSRKR